MSKRIRFYTDSHRYMGWKALKDGCYKNIMLEINSWLSSGNYILTGNVKTEIKQGKYINTEI